MALQEFAIPRHTKNDPLRATIAELALKQLRAGYDKPSTVKIRKELEVLGWHVSNGYIDSFLKPRVRRKSGGKGNRVYQGWKTKAWLEEVIGLHRTLGYNKEVSEIIKDRSRRRRELRQYDNRKKKIECPNPKCEDPTDVIRKGTRFLKNKDDPFQPRKKQIYKCKTCNMRFSIKDVSFDDIPSNIASLWLYSGQSLESLWRILEIKASVSSMYRKIRQAAETALPWRNVTRQVRAYQDETRANKKVPAISWGKIMGIDSGYVSVRRHSKQYIHVADYSSADPLVYYLCEKENVNSITTNLRFLKKLGYIPKIIVSDLGPELSFATEVFPDATVLGCRYHLYRLIQRDLPTKKKEFEDDRIRQLWRRVKRNIALATFSKTKRLQKNYLRELKIIKKENPLDKRANDTINNFLDKVDEEHNGNRSYYPPLNSIMKYGKNALYNNICESHIGLIKRFWKKTKNPRNQLAAYEYIDLYWQIKRESRMTGTPLPITEPKPETEELRKGTSAVVPVGLVGELVRLNDLAAATGHKKRTVKKIAKKMGLKIRGNYAFSIDDLKLFSSKMKKLRMKIRKARLDKIKQGKEGKTDHVTLRRVMDYLDYDALTTRKLMSELHYSILERGSPKRDIVYSPRWQV